MKSIQSIAIGILLGGGFGAKIGSYVSTLISFPGEWNWMIMGFFLGSSLGLGIALAIRLVDSPFSKYSSSSSNRKGTQVANIKQQVWKRPPSPTLVR